MYSKNDLILDAKSAEEGILGTNLPVVTDHFGDFAEAIGLDLDTFYHIKKYINDVSYAEKRAIFETNGFKVLFLTLSAMKVSKFASSEEKGKSLNQQFLDGERNVFIFDVEQGMDNLYFILEYGVDGDPLADHTVDREQLALDQKRSEAAANWYKSIRAKREAKTDEEKTDEEKTADGLFSGDLF